LQLTGGRGRHSIVLDKNDNVVTVLDDDQENYQLADGTGLKGRVPLGHKIALCDIPSGAPVIKYGIQIGTATKNIARGEHVHIHNCI